MNKITQQTFVVACLSVVLYGQPLAAQESKDEKAIFETWRAGASKTAIGNQLLSLVTSATAVLESTPHNVHSLYLRGYLYGTIGCTNLAIHDLSKAIEVDPRNAAAYKERGICYMDQKNYEQARLDLDHAVQLNPSSGDARFARGKLLLEMERPSAALSDLSACQSMSFSPALPGELPADYYSAPTYYLGVCYEALGNPDNALRYYKASIRTPRLGGSGYIHRYSDQPLDAQHRVNVYENSY